MKDAILRKTFGLELDQNFGVNGFTLKSGQSHPHIGIIVEMDALVVLHHPTATILDHAVHSYGHHFQSVVLLSDWCLFHQNRELRLIGTTT